MIMMIMMIKIVTMMTILMMMINNNNKNNSKRITKTTTNHNFYNDAANDVIMKSQIRVQQLKITWLYPSPLFSDWCLLAWVWFLQRRSHSMKNQTVKKLRGRREKGGNESCSVYLAASIECGEWDIVISSDD
jgi:hypothetical protein